MMVEGRGRCRWNSLYGTKYSNYSIGLDTVDERPKVTWTINTLNVCTYDVQCNFNITMEKNLL